MDGDIINGNKNVGGGGILEKRSEVWFYNQRLSIDCGILRAQVGS